jgi:thiamine biosynthesis lipoprotein
MDTAVAPTLGATEWPLWSTQARLVVTDARRLGAARDIADELFDRIDLACSRFRGDSELNRIAPRLPDGVEVSETLALLVRHALAAAESTDGDVDPTLGHALSAIGYDRDIRLVLADDGGRMNGETITRAVVSARPGWRSLRLVGRQLRLPAHLALDLGATAKAVAADLAAAEIARRLGVGVLVSLGGDIATAGPAPRHELGAHSGWNILVQDLPTDPRARVRLEPGFGLATSSIQKRRWTSGGRPFHHLLDPRTGLPVPAVWRSVTVSGRSCLAANTLSTAAMVRGADAPAFLASRMVAARLVDLAGAVTVLGGWPPDAAEAGR